MSQKVFQLKGPFSPDVELLPNGVVLSHTGIKDIVKLDKVVVNGVSSDILIGNLVSINDNEFELGQTGTLEIEDYDVQSIKFVNGGTKNASITGLIKEVNK